MMKVTLEEIKAMAQSASGISKIFVHWAASRYGQFFDDYHINIDHDGSVYASTDDLTELKSHTWRRNSGAVGIALACCYNATGCDDLGEYPPTPDQIEALAQVLAVLCKYLPVPCDIDYVMTHAEAANLDGYGPSSSSVERWDGWVWVQGDQPGSGGDLMRGKANWYLQTLDI